MPTTDTHCLPKGVLGTGEVPVFNISQNNIASVTPPPGGRRGIVVMLHGLQSGPQSVFPPQLIDGVSGALPALNSYFGTVANILAADGWQVIMPLQNQEIGYNPSLTIFNDFSNDVGLGARFVLGMQHWWQHVLQYIHDTYTFGASWPVCLFGFSGGAWLTLQLASTQTSTITAFACANPLSIWQTLNPSFDPGSSYASVQTLGMDISPTQLNAVTIPGIVGYGTVDVAVGYGGVTSVASGSNGVAASSVTTLNVISTTDFITNGPAIKVTGLTGGVGWATYSFTGVGGGTLTGCSLLGGSGTLQTGNTVIQATTKLAIANQQAAQPTHPVIANVTGNNHGLYPSDAGQQLYSTPSPTALSSMGTLTVVSTQGMTGSSGLMSIYASDNLWHVVTFSGSSPTTFTGCTYSGNTSATVQNGAPICLSGNGPTNSMSYPYWFSTVVDPFCPKVF